MLLHNYHVDKVSVENKAAFCKQSGVGFIVIGAGLMITTIILGVTDSAVGFICFAACYVVGTAMLITAGFQPA